MAYKSAHAILLPRVRGFGLHVGQRSGCPQHDMLHVTPRQVGATMKVSVKKCMPRNEREK